MRRGKAMDVRCPRIVIAGVQSGAGKTSVSLALTHAFSRRGLRVQTFKVGPDFLDPTYLALASGRPCYNLDGWMMGREYVQGLFARASADVDVSVIEGVMGLFDGAGPSTSEGSTAEVARWLDAPVLLVVNSHGMARSIAALVRGYTCFEPGVEIAGVIANHSGSERHGAWLAESLKSASLPPLVGAVPRGAFPELPSRHLGLVTADRNNLPETVLDSLADAIERCSSVDSILALARAARPLAFCVSSGEASQMRVRIGAAHDAAFHFYYQDTFDEMESRGCEMVRFSPLSDTRLPEELDGLYIGGGYPETNAEALAENQSMLHSIREFAGSGRPVYGECGGLMYLSQGLETLDGMRHPLVGLLPAWTKMRERRKTLGYVEVTLTEDSLWGVKGDTLRGHEFHYSELIEEPVGEGWRTVYALRRRPQCGMRNAECGINLTPELEVGSRRLEVGVCAPSLSGEGQGVWSAQHPAPSTQHCLEGYQRGRILASYIHLHFGSRPHAIERFIVNCEAALREQHSLLGDAL